MLKRDRFVRLSRRFFAPEIGERAGDAVRDSHRILVLPEAQHRPALRHQVCGRFAVAGDVAVELVAPPFGIGFGVGGVFGAAVPEAAVEEDRDLGPGKGDVDRATGKSGTRRCRR